jgi:Flp pilus assembly pilin Flp
MNEVSNLISSVKLAAVVLKSDQRGVTAVEYALVAGALVLGVGAAITVLTGSLKNFFTGLTL